VIVQHPTTKDTRLVDLPLITVNGVLQENLSGYPGYAVLRGTGEDTDCDGKYTPAFTFNRDFNFGTNPDPTTRVVTNFTFTNTYFDNFPVNPKGTTSFSNNFAGFEQAVWRVDAFQMANNAEAGLQGGSAKPIFFYGGQASRQDAQTVSSTPLIMCQDARFNSFITDPTSTTATFFGYPTIPRAAYVGWVQQ